jgi:hypothetical protein
MDVGDLRRILSPEGLRLLDEVGPLDAMADVVRVVSTLRAAGHDGGLVAAVLEQARLRSRGKAKFGDFAGRMLFTPAGLEQSTRLRVAALHAGRFAESGAEVVADLGCGIGGDAMALAALDLGVIAVERDELTAAVASFNLAPFPSARVELGNAEDADLAGVGAVWLDPARRKNGARRDGATRLSDPADWSPSLDWAFDLARQLPTGIKLGPGIDRDLIPDDLEAQWISVDREVVELVLWSGILARSGVRRSALVLGAIGASELTGPADSADAETGHLAEYLLEPDGAVIRSRLIGDLARSVDGKMLDPTIAWITTHNPVATPFGQSFRVVARFPLDVKTLKRELKARDIGTLEIKKRGVDIDPAQFRTKLALSGGGSATLVLTRVAGDRVAILAERI